MSPEILIKQLQLLLAENSMSQQFEIFESNLTSPMITISNIMVLMLTEKVQEINIKIEFNLDKDVVIELSCKVIRDLDIKSGLSSEISEHIEEKFGVYMYKKYIILKGLSPLHLI